MKRSIKYRSLFLIAALLIMPMMLNAQIEDLKSIIAPGATLKKLGDGFAFTEGPAADAAGNVYFTDQPNNKIFRWDAASGAITLFTDKAGRSNGMYFDGGGRLITCADEKNQLWAFDSAGNATVLLEDYGGKLLNGPNDLWIDPLGGIYFTDPLYARDYWERDPEMQQDGEHLYYLSADRSRLQRVDSQLEKPNGIIGTPDGKKLFVADIEAGKTWVYDIAGAGKLENKRLFVAMGSDGMTLDSDGNLYLTGHGVHVYDKQGVKIATIPVPGNWTANICFGGKDFKTLFITASEAVWSLEMQVSGAR